MRLLLLLLGKLFHEAAARQAACDANASCSEAGTESALLQAVSKIQSRLVVGSPSKGQIAQTAKIFVSGLSSGADFAVQFQVAYSARVSGAAIFAGQPYRCATTRFPQDELQPPNPEVPICEGCPPNKTLIYDHCKHHPSWVDVDILKAVTESYFKDGLIDDPSNMEDVGIYCYRGTADSHYDKGSVKKTAEYFAQFASSPSNVEYVDNIPSGHAYPLPGSSPWPCGTGVFANTIPFQDCKYDGLGTALTHIYNVAGMQISSPKATSEWSWDALKWFDQEPFWGDRSITRLEKWALVYVPERCASDHQTCNLMVSFHGCGFVIPGLYEILVVELNLNAWAEANDMVVLYPRVGALGSTDEQKQGCWNVYGQTGADYATKNAGQMNAIWQMVSNVTKLQLSGSINPFAVDASEVEQFLNNLSLDIHDGEADIAHDEHEAKRRFERFADWVVGTA